MLCEMSQTEKDKYHMISFKDRIWKTKQAKQHRLIDKKNNWIVARGEGAKGIFSWRGLRVTSHQL